MIRLGPTQRVALTVAASLFVVLLDGSILNTSLPRIAASLGVATLNLTLSVTVYPLAAAVVMPSAGWLAGRFGPRRSFMTGLVLFTLASVFCGLAQSLPALVIARAVQGLGGGMMLPIGRILALRQASKAELIQATALVTWPALMAPVIGPALGGYISTYIDWRWNFWLNLPLGALALLICAKVLPADPPPHSTPFDTRGALLAGLGSVALLAGLELAPHVSRLPHGVWWMVASIALAVVLIATLRRHLARTEQPLVRLEPFAVRTFSIATLTGGVPFSMCLQATPFLLPLMFQLGLGWSAVEAGSMVLYYFLGNLMIKPVTTPLLRWLGFRRLMIVCSTLGGLTIAACGAIDANWPVALMAVLLFVTGASRSTQLTAQNTLMFADIGAAHRNSASTIATVLQQLAGAFGVAISSVLLIASSKLSGHEGVQQADFQHVLVAVGALAMLCAFLFSRLPADAGAEVSGHARPST